MPPPSVVLSSRYIKWTSYRVSEWLLFNAKMSNVSTNILARTSFIRWDDNDIHFVKDQHAKLDYYSASSLKQQSVGRHVASDTWSWLRANQSWLLLLNVVCLVEKQQIPIIQSWARTHTIQYTTDTVKPYRILQK